MVKYAAGETVEDAEKPVFKLDSNFILEILVKLNLEVFGAAGAVWGFSEVVTLRNAETVELWRAIAASVGVLFLARWAYYIHEHVTHKRLYIVTHEASTTATIKAQTQDVEAAIKFRGNVKAVVAAAKFKKSISKEARERRASESEGRDRTGSIGGNSDVRDPRGASTGKIDPRLIADCREATNVRTELGFAEPLLKNKSKSPKVLLPAKSPISKGAVDAEDDFVPDPFKLDVNFIVEILVKLNNEVFGAAGAVWGFSEIVFLRHEETLEVWRKIAIAVGVIFFMRWCYYIYGHISHERLYIVTHQASTTANIKAQTHVPNLEAQMQFRGNVTALVAAGKFKKSLSKNRRLSTASTTSIGSDDGLPGETEKFKPHNKEKQEPVQEAPDATVSVENGNFIRATSLGSTRGTIDQPSGPQIEEVQQPLWEVPNEVPNEPQDQVADPLPVADQAADQAADQVGIEISL